MAVAVGGMTSSFTSSSSSSSGSISAWVSVGAASSSTSSFFLVAALRVLGGMALPVCKGWVGGRGRPHLWLCVSMIHVSDLSRV